jgi:hypothetical protein
MLRWFQFRLGVAGRLGYGLLGFVLARWVKSVMVRRVCLCSGKARQGGCGKSV